MNEIETKTNYEQAQRAAQEGAAHVAKIEGAVASLERRADETTGAKAAALTEAAAELLRATLAGKTPEEPGAKVAGLSADGEVIARALAEAREQLSVAQRAAILARADELEAEGLLLAEQGRARQAEVAGLLDQAAALDGGDYHLTGGDTDSARLIAEGHARRLEALQMRRSVRA